MHPNKITYQYTFLNISVKKPPRKYYLTAVLLILMTKYLGFQYNIFKTLSNNVKF